MPDFCIISDSLFRTIVRNRGISDQTDIPRFLQKSKYTAQCCVHNRLFSRFIPDYISIIKKQCKDPKIFIVRKISLTNRVPVCVLVCVTIRMLT